MIDVNDDDNRNENDDNDPTDPIENESVENLSAFLYEISEYILDHDLTEEARKQGLPYEFKNGIPTIL